MPDEEQMSQLTLATTDALVEEIGRRHIGRYRGCLIVLMSPADVPHKNFELPVQFHTVVNAPDSQHLEFMLLHLRLLLNNEADKRDPK